MPTEGHALISDKDNQNESRELSRKFTAVTQNPWTRRDIILVSVVFNPL